MRARYVVVSLLAGAAFTVTVASAATSPTIRLRVDRPAGTAGMRIVVRAVGTAPAALSVFFVPASPRTGAPIRAGTLRRGRLVTRVPIALPGPYTLAVRCRTCRRGVVGAGPVDAAGRARAFALLPTIRLRRVRVGIPPGLARPLHLPTLAAAAPCPIGAAHFLSASVGPGHGDGPAYAVIGASGSLPFDYPPDPRSVFAGSAWSGQKVLWAVAPTYPGPVLIRGRRLDGVGRLGFENGNEPPDAMLIPSATASSAPEWRYKPSYTRLAVPGCYAWQVDGRSFSEVIAFRATLFPAR
jgi:hypothetical protein